MISNNTNPTTENHLRPNGFHPSVKKIVIPRIEPKTRSTFFTFTNTSIKTEDDPILRFIPYIPGASGFINLTEFKNTGFIEKCYSYDKEVVKGTLPKKLDVWDRSSFREECVKDDGLRIMRRIFCNVCFIFGCRWHSKTEGICIKPVGFEKNPTNAFVEARDICGDICKKMKITCKESTKEELDFNAYNALYEACMESQGYECIASLLFYFRYKKYIPCTKIKDSCAIPPGRHKYLIESKSKNNVDFNVFFTPCDHSGNCTKENGCVCISNKTNCEMSCLCAGCKNFFIGCRCSSACDNKCRCRQAMRECIQTCSCNQCGNRDIQLGKKSPIYVSSSKIEGYGLFAKEKISKGKFIIEYVGEIISNEEAERRGTFYDLKGCSYLFDLYSREGVPLYVIDSRFIGNESRFINHSKKNSNLNALVLLVNGIRRIGFYASRDIDKNEELFFDYKYSEKHKKKHGIKD
ncbi:SET domain-containing protein [Encephalitozoon intestinalis ATCC 50506]|uniref:SET domain-containing protein n=1 Tax=Encephalitozoon intestinalis (strain ATCC 50506) TaxID=876142 RepID=E0S962_ENCIT|nr:SET domain-containing protein [Encephalitozoon intestinalis ATCC 50506]ADM12305.1 SET domain-containing protein [Encephalitozoon intestinalis ATCC 50506]UTX46116.1 histone-lysine N-methyltransferase EZH2 [Encephalitozoon intestinalis]